MKNSFILILTAMIILFVACEKTKTYPIYEVAQVTYVPDSVKAEYRKWIQETIQASHQHLSAGEYEDVYGTIHTVKHTADAIFQVSEQGLIKMVDNLGFHNVSIPPCRFTPYEKQLFDSLKN